MSTLLPFLASVDNEMLTVGTLDGSGDNVRNITTGLRLRDGNATPFFTCQQIREESLL